MQAAMRFQTFAAICLEHDHLGAEKDWASRQMEMGAEDAKRLLAAGQKFAETRARLVSKNWLANGSAGST
jgi:hypothetical protein